MQQQARGVSGVTAEEVFIGNGVSELIDLDAARAARTTATKCWCRVPTIRCGPRPSPSTAAARCTIPCRPENGFVPDPDEIERARSRPRTRAIVVINPNNPTGAVYPRAVLEALARLAERARPGRLQRRDLRPDGCTTAPSSCPMATLVHDTLCATMSGPVQGLPRLRLPRRLGRCSPGRTRTRRPTTSRRSSCSRSLRLCSNVPAQWAVQTALGGHQSIRELVAPGGRLYESRRAILDADRAQPLPRRSRRRRRDVCLPGRRPHGAAGLRRPAVRARPARAEARAGRPGSRASTCPTAITSASRTCRTRRRCARCSRASRSCSRATRPRPGRGRRRRSPT